MVKIKHIGIFALIALIIPNIFATSKTKKVSVDYIYYIPENVSGEEAREIAVQRAKAQSIADEFGTYVSQSSISHIEISNEDINNDFLSIGGSELKGEWIETTSTPNFEYITDGGMLAIKVHIEGIIRNIENAKIPYDVKVLRNGIHDINESNIFMDGDDLYMTFKTPTSGFLTIYLIDSEKMAYCLLPYSHMEEGVFKVKPNHRYVFFHPDYSEGIGKDIVDEIVLESNSQKERNRILAIFSPNKFYKANDNLTDNSLPRNLTYMEFQKWLSNVKKKDPELSVTETLILISKE